jgi:hypothetical protein
MKLTLSRRTPASWHDWLYWNVKLEEQ